MTKLAWDQDGTRYYETGTKNGVLFKKDTTGNYGKGVAWNGLTGVTVSPSGAEETALYADDRKYLSLYSAEETGATLEAYTFPDEWYECDGSAEIAKGVHAAQQTRRGFGFCWRTVVGNDTEGENKGYKLHFLYNGMASPSERSYATINDSPEAITFSWEVTTTPVEVNESYKPTAYIVIDSTTADPTKLAALEAIIYGTEETESRLPLPSEIITLMGEDTGNTGD